MSSWIIFGTFFLGIILATNGASIRYAQTCGGVVSAGGEITYKVSEKYDPSERCVWTILNAEHGLVSVFLEDTGLIGEGDNIEMFYVPRNGSQSLLNPKPTGAPHCSGPLLTSEGDRCIISSSVVFLVFRSNADLQGTGFRIKIQFIGVSATSHGEHLEAYSLAGQNGFEEYQGDYTEPYKKVIWTLASPSKFVLHSFNITPECNSSTVGEPTISVFLAGYKNPILLHTACGSIPQPIKLFQEPSVLEPLIIMYTNGDRHYSKGETRFYWNLENPPTEWKPEPGEAAKFRSAFVLGITLVALIMGL